MTRQLRASTDLAEVLSSFQHPCQDTHSSTGLDVASTETSRAWAHQLTRVHTHKQKEIKWTESTKWKEAGGSTHTEETEARQAWNVGASVG